MKEPMRSEAERLLYVACHKFVEQETETIRSGGDHHRKTCRCILPDGNNCDEVSEYQVNKTIRKTGVRILDVIEPLLKIPNQLPKTFAIFYSILSAVHALLCEVSTRFEYDHIDSSIETGWLAYDWAKAFPPSHQMRLKIALQLAQLLLNTMNEYPDARKVLVESLEKAEKYKYALDRNDFIEDTLDCVASEKALDEIKNFLKERGL